MFKKFKPLGKWLVVLIASCTVTGTIGATTYYKAPNIVAEGAILIEPKTNTVLYEKNAYDTFYPASITKILTALIVSEELKEDALIRKSEESLEEVPWDSSSIGLNVGDIYTKEEGLYGLLLGSDNFIAYDLACRVAGDIGYFAEKMNERARSLGAYASNFVNPHGYHAPNHYTTPYDMAQIARGAFANPKVAQIAGSPQHVFSIYNTGVEFTVCNSSRLLKRETPYYNPNVVCCKTGFHDDAGQTLVAKAVYDDIELIAVVMKDSTPTQYEDMNRLFEYGRENFSLKEEDGIYILENATLSLSAKESADYFSHKGWINKGLNFKERLTGETLTNLLKKIGKQHLEQDIDWIIDLLGIEEEDYVTYNELATIIAYLENKWEQGELHMDTTLLSEEELFYRTDEIDLEDAVEILYDVVL